MSLRHYGLLGRVSAATAGPVAKENEYRIAQALFLAPSLADLTTARLDGTVVTTDASNASLAILTADVAGDTSTTQGIAPGGRLVSTIDTIGDWDFFRIELVAGRTYEIGQFAFTGGPSGVPLADAYLEIYDANGTLVTTMDGGGPNTPNGLDALLSFAPTTSGTYYINARAFDNLALDGDRGDLVGDYQLFVNDTTGAPAYVPYYSPDSPLHSIDWGSQIDRTSRNPDGAEGPRVTGNAYTGVGSNPFGIEGKNVVTVYFAKAGDVFVAEDPTNPGLTDTMVAKGFADWEKQVFTQALAQFAEVADLEYVEVANRNEADFNFITYVGTPGPGISLLGRMSPPNEQNEGQAEFNAGDYRWTEANLQPGAFSFVTLIHELGHGHGLAHPHDNGGRSSVMRGTESSGIGTPIGTIPDPIGVYPDYSTGDFELNQGIYTMMSYEDGWQSSPYGNAPTDAGYGYLGGLSAFDIAAIQDKYGVNEEWATGNDTYVLADVNAPGTFFTAIWDAGGVDAITYDGARDATIDLRAATLKYEIGGGGWMSYADGIFGGYTIANGVTIENARTGSGDDRLVGNDVANILSGGAGDDILYGGKGSDRLEGGEGSDTAVYLDNSSDFVIDLQSTSAQQTYGHGADTLVGIENVIAGDGRNTLNGDAGANRLEGKGGNDLLQGRGGDDVLVGGAGKDTMRGGTGADSFVFEKLDDSAVGTLRDLIHDFQAGVDRIDLSGIDAVAATPDVDDAFSFIGGSAFSGAPGELRYYLSSGNTILAGDVNGDRAADFEIMLASRPPLGTADFVL